MAKIAATTAAATADDAGDGVDDGEDDGIFGDGQDDDIFASFALEDGSDVVTSHRTPRSRRIVYAVPGDPCVAGGRRHPSRARQRRRRQGDDVARGVFLEPTLAAIGVDVMPGFQSSTPSTWRGRATPRRNCDSPTLLCQLRSNAVASDVKLTLMAQFPEDQRACWFTPRERRSKWWSAR